MTTPIPEPTPITLRMLHDIVVAVYGRQALAVGSSDSPHVMRAVIKAKSGHDVERLDQLVSKFDPLLSEKLATIDPPTAGLADEAKAMSEAQMGIFAFAVLKKDLLENARVPTVADGIARRQGWEGDDGGAVCTMHLARLLSEAVKRGVEVRDLEAVEGMRVTADDSSLLVLASHANTALSEMAASVADRIAQATRPNM